MLKHYINPIVQSIKENDTLGAIGISLMISLALLFVGLFIIFFIVVPWFIHPICGVIVNLIVILPLLLVIYIRCFMKDE